VEICDAGRWTDEGRQSGRAKERGRQRKKGTLGRNEKKKELKINKTTEEDVESSLVPVGTDFITQKGRG